MGLVAASGYEGLTMRALARALGVRNSVLYGLVSSKEEVLRFMEERLVSLVDVSGFGSSAWEEAVAQWARSYRNVFGQHPPLVAVIAVLPLSADVPQTLNMYEVTAKNLAAAGIPQHKIIPCIEAIEAFVFGSAYAVSGRGPSLDSAKNRAEADSAFELGLAALVAGIGRLREQPSDVVRPDNRI
jgi:AcrR family transcriptional regulator